MKEYLITLDLLFQSCLLKQLFVVLNQVYFATSQPPAVVSHKPSRTLQEKAMKTASRQRNRHRKAERSLSVFSIGCGVLLPTSLLSFVRL